MRAFLKAPAKSERGLPRRPVVGTAVRGWRAAEHASTRAGRAVLTSGALSSLTTSVWAVHMLLRQAANARADLGAAGPPAEPHRRVLRQRLLLTDLRAAGPSCCEARTRSSPAWLTLLLLLLCSLSAPHPCKICSCGLCAAATAGPMVNMMMNRQHQMLQQREAAFVVAQRPARLARSRRMATVVAVASPERVDVKSIPRPDPSGRFGRCALVPLLGSCIMTLATSGRACHRPAACAGSGASTCLRR